MGDSNELASGTVAHKHSAPSSDGGTLSTSETLISDSNLYARILVGA
jgi:hypothetical protein